MKSKKITINLPMDLYNKVLDNANSMGLNLTSQIIVYLDKCINEKETIHTLNDLLFAIEDLKKCSLTNQDKNEE